ncbi:hypothetical protein GCM10027425_28740 [Alteromonas gracilis]
MRTRTRGLTAAALSVACCAGLTVSATAEPDGTPSQEQVQAAQAEVIRVGNDVASLRAGMLLAQQRQEEVGRAAAVASERYNGVRYRLEQARAAHVEAQAQARAARADVLAQRETISAMVADSYVNVQDISALQAVIGADGPAGVMSRLSAVDSVNEAMEKDFADYRAASAVARSYEASAERQRERAERLEAQAAQAQQEAQAAYASAEQQVASLQGQEQQMLRRLARAQGISVELARTRQAALAEEARRAASERAARAAAQAEREARAEARERAERRADRPSRDRDTPRAEPAPRPRPQPAPQPAPAPRPDPAPRPKPAPAPAPPAPGGGVSAAIAFARAQIGEPYAWGGSGPSSWDCSGLTAGAWGSAGTYLPHWSVGQYQESTPISRSQLRPGDLVFYSDSGSSSGIYHVGLYTGGGMMVHAPRTGRNVEEVGIDSWTTPTHFARP